MPKLINDKLTIPEEIIKASKINVNKPIYFYKHDSEDYIWLSNKKRLSHCFGCTTLNKDNSFELFYNLRKLLYVKEDIYSFYIMNGAIYFKPEKYTSSLPSSQKLYIPSEILNACKVNFKWPVYLCCYSNSPRFYYNSAFYLSNFKGNAICFGRVNLDIEKCIEISENMFLSLPRSTVSNIALAISGNTIELKFKDKY